MKMRKRKTTWFALMASSIILMTCLNEQRDVHSRLYSNLHSLVGLFIFQLVLSISVVAVKEFRSVPRILFLSSAGILTLLALIPSSGTIPVGVKAICCFIVIAELGFVWDRWFIGFEAMLQKFLSPSKVVNDRLSNSDDRAGMD